LKRASRDGPQQLLSDAIHVGVELGIIEDTDLRFDRFRSLAPNAFALPGGFIYVSRGLLTLLNNEEELACVIGHEISHVAFRHAAAQQAVQRGGSALVSPWVQVGRKAAYSRDLEHTADKFGQKLCAAAGYDPRGMATFLDALDRNERLRGGYSRYASFFDTHPTSARRSAIARVQASELRWKRDPKIGDPREAVLRKLEGLPVGQRPEAGMFRGDVFFHPDLDFKLRFPRGWRKSNTNAVVGAQAPGNEGVVFLAGGGAEGDPREVAEDWVRRNEGQFGSVRKSGPFSAGRIRAWQLEIDPPGRTPFGGGYVTFIPHNGATWRITGVANTREGLQRTHATARSFRGLSDQDRTNLRSTRLAIVKAKSGEDVIALSKRTQNVWSPADTAAVNDIPAGHRFSGGELVKIVRREAYAPKPRIP
jgi:predicted Zn-dependent protease